MSGSEGCLDGIQVGVNVLPYEEIGTSQSHDADRNGAQPQLALELNDDPVTKAVTARTVSETSDDPCCVRRLAQTVECWRALRPPRRLQDPHCLRLEGVEETYNRHEEQCEPKSPTTVISNGAVMRPRKATMAKKGKGMKKEKPTSVDVTSKLLALQQDRAKLRTRILLTRYELELLTANELSRQEDLSLKIRYLENEVDLGELRPAGSSKLSRPMAPEGVCGVNEPKTYSARLSALETAARSLTSLSDKTNAALMKLHNHAMAEQLGADDAISRCAPESRPVTNPRCPSKSNGALDTMLPTSMEADRGAVYISTNTAVLRQLWTSYLHTSPDQDLVTTVPMFSKRATRDASRCHSLSATLALGHQLVEPQLVTMIVDSGAAESGADLQQFLALFPQLEDQIEKVTDRRFIDAQDREIPLVGRVKMRICLNAYCYETHIYVFKRLGVPFLLGVNSLVDGDLVIHPSKGRLMPADAPEQAVQVHGGARHAEGQRIAVCSQEACPCQTPSGAQVTCDIPRRTVVFEREGSNEVIRCEETHLTDGLMALVSEKEDRLPMKVMHGVQVPGRRGTRPGRAMVKLKYTSWIEGPDHGVLIEPDFTLLKSLGLDSNTVQHSTFDAHAMLPLINHGPSTVYVAPDQIIAFAEPNSAAVRVGGAEVPAYEDSSPSRVMLALELESYEELAKKPFAEGGPPVSEADWDELGLDLSKSIHPGRRNPDGSFEPLPEGVKDRIRAIGSRWWLAWSRDDRAPRISRLVVIDIPTGDAKPVASRPYPIPEKYKAAVMAEMQKLLDAGLIEPGISDWASPTLLTVKKDSTTQQLKVKIVCDFRKLNEVTVVDSGGLGNQEEILSSFGGGQIYAGIMDIAGGFYQFALSERDRHKSAFVLPTSMGGTSFIWRVAPYGLCRNPASYSRGMMFALQGLHDVSLSPLGQSRGGTHSWIDDVTCHADSMEGFLDQFERVLQRLCHCGLTLKASKAHLLHEKLEVLGYYVTPDGLQMQEKKIEAIKRMPPPSNIDEARVYLGAVNFYRRFIPKIGMLAKPLTNLLSKAAQYDQEAIESAVNAINSFLVSDQVMGLPDFTDPNAEFVICPDACNVAVGGVLLQWQHPDRPGPGPPPGVPMRGEAGRDPINQSWRPKHGWRLVTIGYYSKSLDSAQRNYNVFDKEGGAILMCLRHWADIVTACPTTVYTDSSVAASMLTKYQGTTRLQRWGMELMQYLPFLKIAYRKGVDNGMGDLLSRFPLFQKYVPLPEHTVSLPDDLFEKIGESVTSPVARVHATLRPHGTYVSLSLRPRTDYFELFETKEENTPGEIWQEPIPDKKQNANVLALDQLAEGVALSDCPDRSFDRLQCFVDALDNRFGADQARFEEHMETLELYSQAYASTFGDGPVVYDLYCGEGGFSRGARSMGARCFGFDSDIQHRHAYENDPTVSHDGRRSYSSSGMTFLHRDVDSSAFWEELRVHGRIGNLPPPDLIHASPPCRAMTSIRNIASNHPPRSKLEYERIDLLIDRLRGLEEQRTSPLLWQIENVPDSRQYVTRDAHVVMLCGLMMGHRVFRHRVFYCNYPAEAGLPHDHRGHLVGSRGLNSTDARVPNMYGVYSKGGRATQGSYDEWNSALGFAPGTFTRTGIRGALPLGYGRYLVAQAMMWQLNAQFAMPVYRPQQATSLEMAALRSWALRGYPHDRPIGEPVAVADSLEPSPSVNKGLRVVEAEPRPEAVTDSNSLEGVVAPAEPTSEGVAAHAEPASEGVGHPTVRPAVPPLSYADLTYGPVNRDIEQQAGRSIFDVSPEEQAGDPAIARLARSLQNPDSTESRSGIWEVRSNGLVYRRAYDSVGEPRPRLCLPSSHRYEVMHHSHYTLNPGHRSGALFTTLRRDYYWENMQADCEHFVRDCRHCGARRPVPAPQVDPGHAPTPRLPFEVIHLDFKGPLKGSEEFDNILVVVCALTRYVIYIATKGRKATTVFRELVNRVFSVFGPPRAIVSDNANEFRGELAEEMSKYLGYRKVHVLPWRPQANGTAEAAVKRIKLLLSKHTQRFNQWHKVLSLAQYALNTSIHHGLGGGVNGMSSFALLFGREPVGIPELENPDLAPVSGDGSEFVTSLRHRLEILHEHVRAASDEIKAKRRAAASEQIKAPSRPIAEGDLVWLRYGSKQNAARLERAGEASRHPYRVIELSQFGAKLQPTEGARRTLEWQPLHNLQHAPHHFHADHPTHEVEDGLALAPGVARQRVYARTDPSNPLSELEECGQPPNDDGTYQIERIVSARKVANKWHVLIKWAGWTEPTEETRTWMHDNCDDPDILAEVERSITSARGNATTYYEYGQAVDSDGTDSDEDHVESELVVRAAAPVVDSLSPLPSLRIYLISYLRAYRSLC